MSRVYETAIRIGASISKSFKGDALNAASALKKLTEQTKQLKAAEKAAASYKKLDGELARAKSRYDIASAAVRRLEEAERAAGGATKESTRWRKAGAREVAAAARQVDRATKASSKHSEVLRKLGVDTSKLASEQQRLTRALEATERQEKSLGRYEAARERLFGAKKEKTPLVHKAGEQIRGFGEQVLMLGGAAVGAGGALYELVSKVAEGGDQAAKMAKRVGMGVEALQELRYAGERSGATIEDVDSGIGKLAINIGKWKAASKGKGGGLAIPGVQMLGGGNGGAAEGVDPFKRLHLSAAKLATMKPEAQIGKIADAMGKLKTDADRAAVAQAIFGREGGLTMIPMLKEGSAGLEKLRQQARATGGVMSEEATKKAEEFKDAQIDARLAAAGLVNTLGVALLPVATRTFGEFSSWAKKQDFQKRAVQISQWIETKGVPLFKALGSEAKSFVGTMLRLVDGAAKLAHGYDRLGYAVVALRLAPLGVTMGKIGIETFKAADALFKYSAATKAVKAAGGDIPGFEAPKLSAGGKLLGAAASAAMLASAAAVGYQIGTFIDEKLGASDSFVKLARYLGGDDAKEKKLEDTNAEINKTQLETRRFAKDALVRKYEGKGLSHGQAIYVADRLTTGPRTGGPAIDLSNLNITIAGGSREEMEKQLDAAFEHVKTRVLKHLREKDANHRRTTYGDDVTRSSHGFLR